MSRSRKALNGCRPPFRMRRSQRLDAVDDEGTGLHRLLAPQRAVIVEGGDASAGAGRSRGRVW